MSLLEPVTKDLNLVAMDRKLLLQVFNWHFKHFYDFRDPIELVLEPLELVTKDTNLVAMA